MSIRRWFWIWLAVGLLSRIAPVIVGRAMLERAEEAGFAFDGREYYLPMAECIAQGEGFAFKPGHPMASHMPGYPLMLVAARSVLPSFPAAIYVVQVICGGLVVGLVFLLAARLATPAAAHLAALIALVMPDLVIYSLINMSEMPFLLMIVAGSLVMARFWHSGRLLDAALVGLVAGLGAYVRESMVAFIGTWLVAVLLVRGDWPWPRRCRTAGVMAGVFVLMMVPWWVRNAVTIGEFIPLTTKGVWNLYCGTLIRPYYLSDARNASFEPDPQTKQREDDVIARRNAAGSYRERDRIVLAAALDNIRREPWAQIKFLGKKALFLWEANIAPRHAARMGPKLAPIFWLIAAMHYTLLALGVIGMVLMRRDRAAVAVVILPFVLVTAFHIVVGIGEPRYHLPVFPFLIVAAGTLLTLGWARIKGGARYAPTGSHHRRPSPD